MTISERRRRDVAVVVAAGGAGVRLGPGGPKALRLLAGAPLLVHALRGVTAARCVGFVVVVAPPGQEDEVRALVDRAVKGRGSTIVVPGGRQRQESVAAGLAALPTDGPDIVLVHDAARALAPPQLMEQVADAVRQGHDAVIPVLPVTDTVVQVDAAGTVTGQPDRGVLRAVQTPQGFRRAVLLTAHRAGAGAAATDDAGLVARLGVPVHTVPGSPYAMKVTTPHDLAIAGTLLDAVAPPG